MTEFVEVLHNILAGKQINIVEQSNILLLKKMIDCLVSFTAEKM